MTERGDQLHHNNTPAQSTALVQAVFGKALHHQGLSAPVQSRFVFLRLLAFPKAKIAVKRRRFVNETVTQYTRSFNGVSLPNDWTHGRVTVHRCPVRSPLTGCEVTSRPRDRFFKIFKMAGYFPDSPRTYTQHHVTKTTARQMSHFLKPNRNP